MAANSLLEKKASKKKKSTHLSGPNLDHTDVIFPREDTGQLYLYLLIPPISSSAQLSGTITVSAVKHFHYQPTYSEAARYLPRKLSQTKG